MPNLNHSCTWIIVISSQLEEVDGRLVPNPEARIDRLTKGGLEAMDERHFVPHSVERESPPGVV